MMCHPERSEGFPSILRGGFLAALGMTLLFACTQHVDRAQWQHMSPQEKNLYTRSLIGAEKVKERKGGNDRVFRLTPDDYIKRIEAAYARGDGRRADVIFEEMGSIRR